MKVIVTGATGFIGRYTVKRLLNSGHEVISITTNKSITDDIKEFINGSDLVTVNSLEEVCKEIIEDNTIIHCAWSNVQNTVDVSHYMHASEQVKFISRIAKFKPKKVIVTGTCYEFGLHSGPVSVKDVPIPNTPYAQAKDFVKSASERILKEENVKFVWARLFYIFGHGQHEKSIYSQLINSIEKKDKSFNMSKGEQLFDYMNVEDVAEKLCVLANNNSPTIVNICNGYPTSLRSLVEMILLENGSTLKLNLGFFPYRQLDSLAIWGAESFASQLQIFEEK
jgi:nucleoside-diphosphate-sugar epimerase